MQTDTASRTRRYRSLGCGHRPRGRQFLKGLLFVGVSSFPQGRGHLWPLTLVAQMVESACSAGDQGSILGWGRSPGEGDGNPLQGSHLENPMDRGAWWSTVTGSQKVGHNWVTNIHTLQREASGMCIFLKSISIDISGSWKTEVLRPTHTWKSKRGPGVGVGALRKGRGGWVPPCWVTRWGRTAWGKLQYLGHLMQRANS